MPIKINMSRINNPFEPYEGDSLAHKIGKLEVYTATTGKPMLKAQFICIDERFKDKQVYESMALDGSADWRIAQLVAAVGVAAVGEDVEIDIEEVVANEAWFGREIICDVGLTKASTDKKSGKVYPPKSTITRFHPAGENGNFSSL